MSKRIFNFSAGPAVLPEPVLKKAQEAIWDVAGSGIGIMEHSHRGKVFDRIRDEAEQACRDLAGIPDNYRVLFLQGGASLQFSMVPMNLLPADRTADYLLTGVWAQKAVKEAKILGGKVHLAASSESTNFDRIPPTPEIRYSERPAFVHLTTNNTIFGTQWPREPEVPAGVPLIADASSDIYSRPIDVSRYGLIYAGAQKNLGPSGVVLVIIRDDLVEAGPKTLPTMLQYRTHAAEKSLYNTPPTFGIYVMGEVFKWIQREGGLTAMAEHNRAKAALLYDFIDQSDFFRGTAQPDSRSLMNVCFRAPTEELENKFIAEATKRGLDGLKGHRSVGGMRASIYNACPRAAVEALVALMKEFEQANRAAARA
jgi:phosphoserine aminotransferase